VPPRCFGRGVGCYARSAPSHANRRVSAHSGNAPSRITYGRRRGPHRLTICGVMRSERAQPGKVCSIIRSKSGGRAIAATVEGLFPTPRWLYENMVGSEKRTGRRAVTVATGIYLALAIYGPLYFYAQTCRPSSRSGMDWLPALRNSRFIQIASRASSTRRGRLGPLAYAGSTGWHAHPL
jgi:hypothetical protein